MTAAWLREPSLMRRTVAALGIAFVLVLGVLLLHDYLETRQSYVQDLAIHNRAELLAPELAALSDATEAGRLMTSLARINESWRARSGQSHGTVIHQLRDASGAVRAAYPPEAGDAFAAGPAGCMTTQCGRPCTGRCVTGSGPAAKASPASGG